ncbi:hypothetical protein bpr_II079 (plasmid) [Butyrivibrio proteoclasticus B316]|uniref:Uncharacterized protein n=1 Tax=Butyrivibrio proteoclasticus (strain ATCC 51982 / DSM 14932 / B316) TaxID=515622 RepID=E0S3N7_BUTPB|nr:hypothetical protein [Butyrivibrio proteoclasticus]ADL36019.1 hypothetical protein bpr_II079 [Butyrivibrio proteoclasticus B316]
MNNDFKNDFIDFDAFTTEESVITGYKFAGLLTKCLIDKNIVESRADVKRRNYIDVTELDFDNLRQELFKNALVEYDQWLSYIPPFEHGTLRAKHGWYITWDIKEINLEDKTFRIRFCRYGFNEGNWYARGTWESLISATYEDGNGGVGGDIVWKTDFMNDIQAITESEFLQHADPMLQEQYLRLYRNRMEKAKEIYTLGGKYADDYDKASSAALSMTHIVNVLLALNNNKTSVKKKSGENIKSVYQSSDNRRIRTLNGISFVSDKAPKAHTEQSIRKYTCASWVVRSHIRKTKTGKTAFVKEHVNKRKNMNAAALQCASIKVVN